MAEEAGSTSGSPSLILIKNINSSYYLKKSIMSSFMTTLPQKYRHAQAQKLQKEAVFPPSLSLLQSR
jgi:hypothetical protein